MLGELKPKRPKGRHGLPGPRQVPLPRQLSSEEEGSGLEGSEERSEEGGEDSEEDVPLARRKVARF